MEVRQYEVRIVEINIRAARTQEDARHAPNQELGQERQSP